MSRSASRSSSSSPDDSDHESAGGRYYSSQATEGGGSTAVTSAAVMSPEPRASRPLDVSNILNPTPQRTPENVRRRSAAHFESPRSAPMANLQNTARSLPPSPVESSESDASRLRSNTLSRHLAHPGARVSRPSSLGNVTSQQHPYGISSQRYSPYPTESAPHSQPPPPPPTAAAQSATSSNYPFPSTAASQQYQSTPQQQPQPQQSYQSHQSQQSVSSSVSPTTPYLSYAPHGQSSLPPVSGPQASAFSTQQYASTSQQSLGSSYSMASHSQHGHFPMMALATAHGSIPVSVDTTAASKSADEKRRRNAGASARFRQRRKEREREMTQRITDLEQRLKKAEEERDYYRDMCMRMPQSGRAQQPPPPPPTQPQHPLQYSQLPPRLGPSPQGMTLDPPPFAHHAGHPPLPPTPAFPRITSDVGPTYSGVQREGSTGIAGPGYQPPGPGAYQHHQSQASQPRRDSHHA
ncbi:hypothetical protein BDZ91DRAFT_760349 [Kalaharituber pfeilii]|nr:hypothetical protein BDZ91DRAFT_760349 [Kalaharituber pfeilii]